MHIGEIDRIISKCPLMVFTWGLADAEKFEFVSDNVRRLGYEPALFYSGQLRLKDIVHAEDREDFDAALAQLVTSGPDQNELQTRIQDSNGGYLWGHVWLTLNRDTEGRPSAVECLLQDVTTQTHTERRSALFTEAVGGIYLVLDPTGKIIEINDTGCQIVGLEREGLLGRDWIACFVPADSRKDLRDYFNRAIEAHDNGPSDRGTYVNDIVTNAGVRLTINWYHVLERDAAGHPEFMIVLGIDITESIESKRLADQYAHFPLDNPNPVLRIDRNGDVMLANTPAQQVIQSVTDGDSDDVDRWLGLIRTARVVTKRFYSELDLLDKSFLFDIVPDPDGDAVNIYGTDISEWKRTERRLHAIVNNIDAAVFEYVRHKDGTDSIHYINSTTFDIWEVDAQDVGVDPIQLWEQIHPDDIDSMQASVQDSARDLSMWRQEFRIIIPDGKVKWLQARGQPHALDNGDILWNTVIVDLTRLKEIQFAHDELLHKAVYVLSAALESRDPYTAGHEQRVAQLSTLIARELHLDPDLIEGLNLAAVIHDIGKISVPFELLNKPTKLSAAEFEVIKEHAQTGANIIADIEFKWPIHDIVLQHHERLDGSGYPQGLKGDQILMQARIIAVADTIEAMAADRPYRNGLGIEAAMEEIKKGAGIKYDPDVVRAAASIIEERRFIL